MRHRAGRFLFNILAAVSLLLCVATCALRWDSWGHNNIVFRDGQPIYAIGLGRDQKAFIVIMQAPPDHRRSFDGWRLWRFAPYVPTEKRFTPDLIFDAVLRRGSIPKDPFVLIFPLWAAQFACAALPLVWIGSRARKWRFSRAPGLCRNCGYDLRASPERCPECGTAVRRRRAIAAS